MIIWRTWASYDMAQSDTYHTTKVAALKQICVSFEKMIVSSLDCWEYDNGEEIVYLERLVITLTREGLCYALQHIPHR